MARRVFIILFVLLFILSPLSLSWPTENISKADSYVSNQTIDTDTTWTLAGSPYVIYNRSYVTVAQGATLTIEPGVIVKLGKTGTIDVFGKIKAQGVEGSPVIFTSINDDARGGRNIDWSNSQPQAGDWDAINILKGGEAVFDNAIINYGGMYEAILVKNHIIENNIALADFYSTGVITSAGGQVNISNSEISHNIKGIISGDYWISENSQISGQVAINNSKIYGNSQGGIINMGVNKVNATNNWWGDDSGPYNLTYNVYGRGDSVSDNVLFMPWTGENTAPKRNPVIIVPGILGSYLDENTPGKPEVWPNISQMVISKDDSYLNELSMNSAGWPNAASLMLPSDIFRSILNKNFFAGLIAELENNGYQENKDLFVFPYDWRWDIDWAAGDSPFPLIKSLKEKVEEVKQQTGADKVDIIAHSMGGLVAEQYIKFYGDNSIDKFIDIGTPHLGSPDSFKTLNYGDNIGITFLDSERIKILAQNFPSVYELLPSQNYFNSADNNYSSYILDAYDYDQNGITGNLNYTQSEDFLKNVGENSFLLDKADKFHGNLDDFDPTAYNVKAYNIIGCSRPTIGKIAIINKEKSGNWGYDLFPITGDGTVPLRSAEDLNNSLSAYYVDNTDHAYLPSANGVKQLVTSLLTGDQSNFNLSDYPNLATSSNFCALSGTQIEYHSPIDLHVYDENGNHAGPDKDGNIEQNIDGASYDIIDGNKFVFLPLGHSYKITGQATGAGTFDADVKNVVDGETEETIYYNEVPLVSTSTTVELNLASSSPIYNMEIDKNGDGTFDSQIQPSSILNQVESADLKKPETTIKLKGDLGNNGWYTSKVKVKLKSQDNEGGSGILKTEYSLDNGNNWTIYKHPFIINKEGTTTVLYQATDRAGNVEITKEKVIRIDKEEPKIKIITPYDGQKFSSSDTLNIVYNVSDSLSGVASVNSSVDDNKLNTTIVQLSKYSAGEHVLKIEAMDVAGNKSKEKVEFQIRKDKQYCK